MIWIPLPLVDMRPGENHMPRPIAIRFPNGTSKEIGSWAEMVRDVVDFERRHIGVQKITAQLCMSRHHSMEFALQFADKNAYDYDIAFYRYRK